MKKIKGLTLLFTMAAMAFTTACSDLTPVDYSEINPNNFPKNESDVEALVTGGMEYIRHLKGV